MKKKEKNFCCMCGEEIPEEDTTSWVVRDKDGKLRMVDISNEINELETEISNIKDPDDIDL